MKQIIARFRAGWQQNRVKCQVGKQLTQDRRDLLFRGLATGTAFGLADQALSQALSPVAGVPDTERRVNSNLTLLPLSSAAISVTAGVEFNTRGLAQAATISGGIQFVWTAGYTIVGDQGGALYVRAGSSTPGGFQSADGAWWQLVGTAVTSEMFGSKGDGSRDDSAAYQTAINYLNTNGGGILWVLAKTYIINSILTLLPNVTVRGIVRDASILKTNMDATGIFQKHNLAPTGFGSIENCTIWGYADRNATLSTTPLAQIGPFETARFIDVRAMYSQQFSLSMYSNQGEVRGCYVSMSLRDAIDVTRVLHDVSVSNNHISGCGDDAIACHTTTSGATKAFDRMVVISGNRIERSFGIKCLGVQNAIIANNTLRFFYGYGVFVGADSNFNQGENAKYNIAITGNSFTDQIDSALVGAGTGVAAILITGGRVQDGLAVPPEEFNPASHAFIPPEPYYNNIGGNGASPANATINIQGNVARQTLNGLAHFSDSGHGNLWSNSGPVNPAISTDLYVPAFVQANADINGLVVSNNSVEGFNYFINATNMGAVRNWVISGNSVRRCANGIVIIPTAAIRGSVLITSNDFDLDPLYESSSRTLDGGGNPTGQWTATDGSNYFGVLIGANMAGVVITGNTFANCRRPWKGLAYYFALNNTVYWDWGTDGSVSRGIAEFDDEIINLSYYRHSDPRAGNFGLDEPGYLSGLSSQPKSGYYRKGVFVANSNPSLSGGKVLRGWIRLTSGNSHVANIDWAAQYIPRS
jgi:hypothetical protein